MTAKNPTAHFTLETDPDDNETPGPDIEGSEPNSIPDEVTVDGEGQITPLTKEMAEQLEKAQKARLSSQLEKPEAGIYGHNQAVRHALEALKDECGTDSPTDVCPIEFVIERVDDDNTMDEWATPRQMLTRSVRVRPRVSRTMLLLLLSAGATGRSGTGRSFLISNERETAEDGTSRLSINRVARGLPAGSLYTKDTWNVPGVSIKKRTGALQANQRQAKLQGLTVLHADKTEKSVGEIRVDFRPYGFDTTGGLELRFATNGDHRLFRTHDYAHQWTRKGTLDAAAIYPEQALAFMASCEEMEIPVRFEPGLNEHLNHLASQYTVARAVEGLPGRAHIVEPNDAGVPQARETTMDAALAALKRAKQQGRKVALDPAATDSLRMQAAKPALDGDLLVPQRIPVARIRATELGAVNASMVGTGKTAMTLISERGRAKTLPGYRMLLVCSSALVSQWQEEEFPKFWPEVKPVLVDGDTAATTMVKLDREWGDNPGCFIVTYDAVRRHTNAFLTMTYDTVVMEEGGRLGSPNTQLSRAMWKVRGQAKVGLVLTATPFRKSPSELDAILAWARGNANALKAKPLARRFGSFDQMSLRRLTDSLGPAFVRVTREQMAEHMPDVEEAAHRLIDMSPAERRLKDAIEDQIASLYAELMAKVDAAAALDPDDEQLKEAQRELQSKRGLVLSTISLAQQAALDPEILRHSNATAVAALEASGVLDAAIRAGSTKREIVAETIAAAEADGEQILVFSQSVEGLRLLERELKETRGVEASLYSGALAKAEADAIRKAFQAGDIRTLLLSPIAKEGLNLPASVVIHYDLPWVPADFEQRIGRATRTGSRHNSVAILVPIMRGTIEERVCQMLVPRAAQADAVLNVAGTPVLADNGEVIAGDGSVELAVQLGGIADELAGREDASLRMKIAAQIFAERRGSQ